MMLPFWPSVSCQSQKGGTLPQANIAPRKFSPEELGLYVGDKSQQGEWSQHQCGPAFSGQSEARTEPEKVTLPPHCAPDQKAGWFLSIALCIVLPDVFRLSNQPVLCVHTTTEKPSDKLALACRDTASSSDSALT